MHYGIFSMESGILLKLLVCIAAGFIIGSERESRKKAAGISTQSLVIGGAMMFTLLSQAMNPSAPTQIAAQIVTGVGFLGAGIILRGRHGEITNLTTAASIWFAAAIGIAIGFGWYLATVLAVLYAALVPYIPHLHRIRAKLAKK